MNLAILLLERTNREPQEVARLFPSGLTFLSFVPLSLSLSLRDQIIFLSFHVFEQVEGMSARR